ncbi:hypothetical protein EGR_00959 [Echinococcus granulosus]|uniref:Uncharacterized protein n=1 Tax=Echinococcus granulosus TaxID=6210 RepID=W6URR4_ECHGR|nr:hypothetical protein EGR_00959 [Echinococcus granulosus]EUB64415.1 hypothetical protein EGR_00959 [Echinococcus granulosus]
MITFDYFPHSQTISCDDFNLPFSNALKIFQVLNWTRDLQNTTRRFNSKNVDQKKTAKPPIWATKLTICKTINGQYALINLVLLNRLTVWKKFSNLLITLKIRQHKKEKFNQTIKRKAVKIHFRLNKPSTNRLKLLEERRSGPNPNSKILNLVSNSFIYFRSSIAIATIKNRILVKFFGLASPKNSSLTTLDGFHSQSNDLLTHQPTKESRSLGAHKLANISLCLSSLFFKHRHYQTKLLFVDSQQDKNTRVEQRKFGFRSSLYSTRKIFENYVKNEQKLFQNQQIYFAIFSNILLHVNELLSEALFHAVVISCFVTNELAFTLRRRNPKLVQKWSIVYKLVPNDWFKGHFCLCFVVDLCKNDASAYPKYQEKTFFKCRISLTNIFLKKYYLPFEYYKDLCKFIHIFRSLIQFLSLITTCKSLAFVEPMRSLNPWKYYFNHYRQFFSLILLVICNSAKAIIEVDHYNEYRSGNLISFLNFMAFAEINYPKVSYSLLLSIILNSTLEI